MMMPADSSGISDEVVIELSGPGHETRTTVDRWGNEVVDEECVPPEGELE